MVSTDYDTSIVGEDTTCDISLSFWYCLTPHTYPCWMAHDTQLLSTYILIADDETLIGEIVFHTEAPESLRVGEVQDKQIRAIFIWETVFSLVIDPYIWRVEGQNT